MIAIELVFPCSNLQLELLKGQTALCRLGQHSLIILLHLSTAMSHSRREEEEEDSVPEELSRQVFKAADGHPIGFFIHHSLRNPGAREALTETITVCCQAELGFHCR